MSNASLAALVLVPALLAGCGGKPGAEHHARSGNGVPASPTLVRGTVASVGSGALVIQTGTGSVTVKVAQPLQLYQREPATLADVKDGVFIGVTTVKQPDGTEQAREIHIFPEALRGLGEGSHMMTGQQSGNRMTNGAVSGPRMTNGAVSGSRMSNGSVAGAKGSSLVVQYAGGSITVTVPRNTQVTRLAPVRKTLEAGDQVVVPATRAADGSLQSNEVLISGR